MARVACLITLLALVGTCYSLSCYSCITSDDNVSACGKTICNGEEAQCYKREWEMMVNDERVQYEQRSCVSDKDDLDTLCDKNDAMSDNLKKCKVYTCDDADDCNSAMSGALSLVMLLTALFYTLC